MNVVAHNLLAMNAERQFNIVTDKKKKSTEKLSSGFKINRAADDAAGLAISEKMRALIRGLNQGVDNCQDGVSWVQIGDGALDEVHDMLHRMTQLSIKSLNGTNSDSDRAAMQAEFDQLQSEIDRVTKTTEFNTLKIFNEHEATYDQYIGNKHWNQNQKHQIIEGYNDSLTVSYRMLRGDDPSKFTISVPAGEYTTSELVDAIDTALEERGLNDSGFTFEYTGKGYCNLNYENGVSIDSVSGGLSYLLHDMSRGGSLGSLIGTTVFPDEKSRLIVGSENNSMTFWIQDEDGNETRKDLTIPDGFYTKSELIDILNEKLSDTSVKAEAFGKSIKLASDDCIITGFKGNMFKIDTSDPIYTSVFYDNVKYGDISLSKGTFQGGYVLHDDVRDVEHNKYNIDATNNKLILQPNDDASPTTIEITPGQYAAEDMKDYLNAQFAAKGLDVSASVISTGAGENLFKGIFITSNIKDTISKVGIIGGSAYNTLFTDKKYTAFTKINPVTASGSSYAVATGYKKFDAAGALSVDSTNDKFNLVVNGTSYTIDMDHGNYNTPQDVKDMLQAKLDDASADPAYKDKITVRLTASNQLELVGKAGSGVTTLNMTAVSGNRGYNSLIQEVDVTDKTVRNAPGAASYAQIKTNTSVSEPVNITSPTFNIYVDGTKRTVTLTTGLRTHDEIVDEINAQLREYGTPITFSDINQSGSTNSSSSANVVGRTTERTANYNSVGTSVIKGGAQGQAGGGYVDTYAAISTNAALPASMVIDDTNNSFSISINGKQKTFTLDNKTYSSSALVSALQNKIDTEFGKGFGGATVGTDASGRLVIKARSGTEGQGQVSSINININTNNSFLKSVERTYTKGTATSNTLNDSIVITDSSKNFTFSLTDNGVTNSHTITLATGSYTKERLAAEINKQLSIAGIGVTADITSSKLRLTTDKAGTGNSVSFSSSSNDGFYTAAVSGYKNPATSTLNKTLQGSIVIDSTHNGFNLTVNGTDYNLSIPDGTYTPETLKSTLNSVFSSNSVPVNATISGGKLVLTTTTSGSSSSIKMKYSTGGTAMKAMFGETITPGVVASFSGDDLVLTKTQKGGSLEVRTSGGNVFQTGYNYTDTGSVSRTNRSNSKSYIDGVNLTEKVTINDLNNTLRFNYFPENRGMKVVSFTLANKDYTFDELRQVLQDEIDADAGAGEIKVSVGASGVRFECNYEGSNFSMGNFSGGFYDRVFGSAREVSETEKVTIHNGDQANDTAFAVGRKDIRNNISDIKKDINDTLSLDLTVNGAVTKISFTLSPGEYSGSALVKEIQEKMNAALADKGLSENLIRAQVGGVHTGIVGSNDANSLVFKLASDVSLPGEGRYIIDGISGNAAFSVFYQTDGEINVAYTTGMKDISAGVIITNNNNVLTFDYDDNKIEINIPSGKYTKNGIVNELNSQLEATGYPLGAEVLADGTLKIYATKFGKHVIDNVQGSAKSTLFYNEEGKIANYNDIKIQCSSDVDDYIDIIRKRANTCALDINSICISKVENASKAVDRLNSALAKVSEVRSYLGAMQNRIEHTIRNNENKEENLTAADSVIRDTDMAKEMAEYTKNNILEQAMMSILAQANQNPQNILSLLQ